ncbi:MarR family winged helix-turn-helix transcriptional regulator [soil metagenome]
MATTQWLTRVEDEAWRGLRRVYLLACAEISRDLQRDSGLSDADYEVLTSLSESSGDRLRFGDLATATRWSTSRLSHHVDRMQRRGLVERTERKDDGRGSDVALTAHGRATIEGAAPDHVRSVRRHLFDQLTAEQTTQLAGITGSVLGPHDVGQG